jgi:hypothetical protein
VRTPYWLKPLLGLDIFAQTLSRDGKPGVTISARIGTSAAHEKRWGLAGQWLLEKSYPLRKFFGGEHCPQAILHDYQRALDAIYELTDPVVVAWVKAHLSADETLDYGTWRPDVEKFR